MRLTCKKVIKRERGVAISVFILEIISLDSDYILKSKKV